MDKIFKQVYYGLVGGRDIFALRGDRRIFPLTRKVPLVRGEDFAYMIQNVAAREIVVDGTIGSYAELSIEPYTLAFGGNPVLHISPSLHSIISQVRVLGNRYWLDVEKGLPPSETQYEEDSITRYLRNAGYLTTIDLPEMTVLDGEIHPVEKIKETVSAFGKMMRVALNEGGNGGLHYWDNDRPGNLRLVIDTYHDSGTPVSVVRSCGITLYSWRKTIDIAGTTDTYFTSLKGLTDSNHTDVYYDHIPLTFTVDYQPRTSGTLLVGFTATTQKRDYADDYVRSVRFLMNYPLNGNMNIKKSIFDRVPTIGERLVGFDRNIVRSGISSFSVSIHDVVYIYDFNNTTLTIKN